jgi:hypothetical protein
MMAGPDDIDVKSRVDRICPQARKSKRKGWQRLCTVVPRAWELRLLEAKRVSTYRLAIELLYLHWYGRAIRSPSLARWRKPQGLAIDLNREHSPSLSGWA